MFLFCELFLLTIEINFVIMVIQSRKGGDKVEFRRTLLHILDVLPEYDGGNQVHEITTIKDEVNLVYEKAELFEMIHEILSNDSKDSQRQYAEIFKLVTNAKQDFLHLLK